MISVDAAGLLAQILPIGLLVLVVELRAIRLVADRMRGQRRLRVRQFVRVFPFVLTVVVSAAVWAVAVCVTAVITGTPMPEWMSWTVITASYLLYGFAGAVMVILAFITGHHTLGRHLSQP
jgi:hypothetical protein